METIQDAGKQTAGGAINAPSVVSNGTTNAPKLNELQNKEPEKPSLTFTDLVEETPAQGDYFGQKVRIGSRIIRLEVIPKFSMLPSDPKAKQIRDEVVKKIGSQFKRGTRDVIRGLTHEEEVRFLPPILGLKPEHDDWETRVKNFWLDYFVQVPVSTGLELEAGFRLKPKTTEAIPIDINAYMQYNFAKQNSNVANENEDNLITYTYRIVDTSEQIIREERVFSLRKTVDRLFIKLCNDAEKIPAEKNKIDWILETHGGNNGVGLSILGLTSIQKQMELEKIKNRDLEAFRTILEDRDLETKAIIKKAVKYQKIQHEGLTYYYQGTHIGRNLREAVIWLNDPNNSYHKTLILESIKDASS